MSAYNLVSARTPVIKGFMNQTKPPESYKISFSLEFPRNIANLWFIPKLLVFSMFQIHFEYTCNIGIET